MKNNNLNNNNNINEYLINISLELYSNNINNDEKIKILNSFKEFLTIIYQSENELNNLFNEIENLIFIYNENNENNYNNNDRYKYKKIIINKQILMLYPIIFDFDPIITYKYIDKFLLILQKCSIINDIQLLTYLFNELINIFFKDINNDNNNENLLNKIIDKNKKEELYKKIINYCINIIELNNNNYIKVLKKEKNINKINHSLGCIYLSILISKCNLINNENNINNLWNIISYFLNDKNFYFIYDMLYCTIKLIISSKEKFKIFCNLCLFNILDFLTDDNWIIRKISIEIIYFLTLYCKEEILLVKDNIIEFLNILRDDPFPQVKEVCIQTLNFIEGKKYNQIIFSDFFEQIFEDNNNNNNEDNFSNLGTEFNLSFLENDSKENNSFNENKNIFQNKNINFNLGNNEEYNIYNEKNNNFKEGNENKSNFFRNYSCDNNNNININNNNEISNHKNIEQPIYKTINKISLNNNYLNYNNNIIKNKSNGQNEFSISKMSYNVIQNNNNNNISKEKKIISNLKYKKNKYKNLNIFNSNKKQPRINIHNSSKEIKNLNNIYDNKILFKLKKNNDKSMDNIYYRNENINNNINNKSSLNIFNKKIINENKSKYEKNNINNNNNKKEKKYKKYNLKLNEEKINDKNLLKTDRINKDYYINLINNSKESINDKSKMNTSKESINNSHLSNLKTEKNNYLNDFNKRYKIKKKIYEKRKIDNNNNFLNQKKLKKINNNYTAIKTDRIRSKFNYKLNYSKINDIEKKEKLNISQVNQKLNLLSLITNETKDSLINPLMSGKIYTNIRNKNELISQEENNTNNINIISDRLNSLYQGQNMLLQIVNNLKNKVDFNYKNINERLINYEENKYINTNRKSNDNNNNKKIDIIKKKYNNLKFNEALLDSIKNDIYLFKLLPLIKNEDLKEINITLIEDVISRLSLKLPSILRNKNRIYFGIILSFLNLIANSEIKLKTVTKLNLLDSLNYIKKDYKFFKIVEVDLKLIENIIKSIKK